MTACSAREKNAYLREMFIAQKSLASAARDLLGRTNKTSETRDEKGRDREKMIDGRNMKIKCYRSDIIISCAWSYLRVLLRIIDNSLKRKRERSLRDTKRALRVCIFTKFYSRVMQDTPKLCAFASRFYLRLLLLRIFAIAFICVTRITRFSRPVHRVNFA